MAINKIAQTNPAATWAEPVDQLSIPKLVAFHLISGGLVTVACVILAPMMKAAGFPPIAALLAAILIVLVPVELGVVLRTARRDGFHVAVPYRHRLRAREWLWLVPVLIVAAFAGFGVHRLIEPWLIAHVFGWVPEWLTTPVPLDHIDDYSAGHWLVTICAYFLLNGVIGPVVEELYFRGFLLPRMEHLGRWGPLVNSTLFSLYHWWSPWQILARILAITPMIYAVRWKKNVYLGMVVHCALNLLGVVLVTNLVLTRL